MVIIALFLSSSSDRVLFNSTSSISDIRLPMSFPASSRKPSPPSSPESSRRICRFSYFFPIE